jgi:hypothetical protein
VSQPTPALLRKLEATAAARKRTLAIAVEAVNNRPGLATASVDDAAVAATAAPYQWATADDQDRAEFVDQAVTKRVVADASAVASMVARIPLGAVVNLSEMSLPASWSEDYARVVVGLLWDTLTPFEDGAYLRRDRDVPTKNDGHLDVHEYARRVLIDKGLLADVSHCAALLAATELES